MNIIAAILVMTIAQPVVSEGSEGIVVAPDDEAARLAREDLTRAARVFERLFGRDAPRGLVVPQDDPSPEVLERLDLLDVEWTLPWALGGLDTLVAPMEDTLRAGIERELAADGAAANEAIVDALLAAAMADLRTQLSAVNDLQVLGHEIAHMLYITALWPADEDAEQYGGGAPDWLDEMAAVAAEGPELTRKRRARFAAMIAKDRLIPLPEFFSMEHPAMAAVRAMKEKSGGQDGFFVITAEESAAAGGASEELGSDFYAQSRGLLDYVDDVARPHVLTELTNSLRAGGSVADFLRESGASVGLPTTLETLAAELIGTVDAALR